MHSIHQYNHQFSSILNLKLINDLKIGLYSSDQYFSLKATLIQTNLIDLPIIIVIFD